MLYADGHLGRAENARYNQGADEPTLVRGAGLANWRPRDAGIQKDLANRVENAVEQFSREKAVENPTRRWQVLLGILTYCYALGVYGSDEIEQAIAGDGNADALFAEAFRNATPAAGLRAFRRANRQVILQCLASVLGGPDCSSEATERLRAAIEADSFSLDF